MKKRNQAITCPKCSQVQSHTIYEQISAFNEPALKTKILRNELFRFVCDNCGHQLTLLYPSLYHDAVHGFMVYLIPTQDQQRIGKIELDAIMNEYLELKTTRTVRIPNQLAEKIIIFENKLDDRLVELVKQETKHFLQQQQAPDILDIYLNKSENGYYFVIIHGSEDWRTLDVDENVFEIAYDKYASYFEPLKPFAEIDAQWATQIFNQHLKRVTN